MKKILISILFIIILLTIIAVFVFYGISNAKKAADKLNQNNNSDKIQTTIDDESKKNLTDIGNVNDEISDIIPPVAEKKPDEKIPSESLVDTNHDKTTPEKYVNFLKLSVNAEYLPSPREFLWFDETKIDTEPIENSTPLNVLNTFGEYNGVLISCSDFAEYNFMTVSISPISSDKANTEEIAVNPVEKISVIFKQSYVTSVYADSPTSLLENPQSNFTCGYSENLLSIPFFENSPMNLYFYETQDKIFAKCQYFEYESETPSYVLLLVKEK